MRRALLLLIALATITSFTFGQDIFSDVDHGSGSRTHRFDVIHTAIGLRFDEPGRTVIGSVRHIVRSLDPALRSIRLDAAANMAIEQLTVAGAKGEFAHHGDTLDIFLPSARPYGDTITIDIGYRVVPEKGLYFIRPDSLTPERRHQIWTQGEATDNHYWVPIYDSPNDRGTTELSVSLPPTWKGLSNGKLVGSPVEGSDGTMTWHYLFDKPHSSYLIVLAAGNYLVTRDTVDGIPLEYWSYPEAPERVQPTFGRTPEMMRYFTNLLGVPYPWNKYSQIVIDEFMYGGMENTTAVTLNDFALVDERGLHDYNPDGLIAHELAHMWFGDLVTNRSWGHLWLHESFATYLAARYMGYHYGEESFAMEMHDNGLDAIRTDKSSGRNPIVNGKGITANLYDRGSRVLHMLNQLIGEELFMRSCRLFLERHAYGLVESRDLQIAFEDATGLNLDWFFEQWVHKAGYPALRVDQIHSGDTLRLRVRQTQKLDSLTGLFRLQVPVELHLASGVVTDTIQISKQDQTFSFPLRERPRFIIFDAGDATLKTVEFRRTEEELAAQMRSPRMIDRLLAVKEIAAPDSMKGKAVKRRSQLLSDAFMAETSHFVRKEIIDQTGLMDTSLVVPIVVKGLSDPEVEVRQKSVEAAYLITDKERRAQLLRPLLSDSSYNVVGAALGMLAVTDTTGMADALHRLKGSRGRRDRLARAWLNAVASAGYTSMIDDVTDYTTSRFSNDTRSQAYFTLSRLSTTTPDVRSAIERGLEQENTLIRQAAADAARKHLDPQMRRILERLRDRLSGEGKKVVEKVLK